jgi:hypothetical protein
MKFRRRMICPKSAARGSRAFLKNGHRHDAIIPAFCATCQTG